MDGTGHHLLAGAALAENQHWVSTLGCLTNDAVELIHLRCAPNDIAETFIGLDPLTQSAIFDLELEMGFYSFQQVLQFSQAERLGHVVVGAILHRQYCRIDGGIATDDNDLDIGTSMLDLA